jgi:hypothetical protein
MKYMKAFEENWAEKRYFSFFREPDDSWKFTGCTYKRGDYVLLDLDKIKKAITNNKYEKRNLPNVNLGQILRVSSNETPYYIYTYEDKGYFLSDDDIIRKLTELEIENFEKYKNFNSNIKKYNI